MKTKILLMLLASFTISGMYSQANLNDYKYVIVLNKYDFLKSENQYNLNALTAFLFKKYKFTAFMEGDTFPEDLESNGCLALRSDVRKIKGVFKTKLTVVLKNCKDEIIYTSEVGESREKNFKTSYHLALRDAFRSFEMVNYSYKAKAKTISENPENKKETKTAAEIEKLKAELKTLRKVQREAEIKPKKKVEIIKENSISDPTNMLYAQPIEKGFQIVDSTPKVVMILLETPLENTFVVKDENAIIYKQDGFWYLSKNDGKTISIEQLNIKF